MEKRNQEKTEIKIRKNIQKDSMSFYWKFISEYNV